jgi:hypothetical protein
LNVRDAKNGLLSCADIDESNPRQANRPTLIYMSHTGPLRVIGPVFVSLGSQLLFCFSSVVRKGSCNLARGFATRTVYDALSLCPTFQRPLTNRIIGVFLCLTKTPASSSIARPYEAMCVPDLYFNGEPDYGTVPGSSPLIALERRRALTHTRTEIRKYLANAGLRSRHRPAASNSWTPLAGMR